MYWAQFYQLSTGYIAGTIPPQFGKPERIEATGDRSVIILDGRQHAGSHHTIAAYEAKKRGYVGYKLCKGERFTATKETGFYPAAK